LLLDLLLGELNNLPHDYTQSNDQRYPSCGLQISARYKKQHKTRRLPMPTSKQYLTENASVDLVVG
jgi:hypothetical protein